MKSVKDVDRGELTRQALIDAAIKIFARDGFYAASTRELAKAANVNQALINYHFKGKQGLYLAAFQFIVDQIQVEIEPIRRKIQAYIVQHDWEQMSYDRRKEIFLPVLLEIVDEYLKLLTSEKTNEWSQLIIREQNQPSLAFEKFYQSYIAPIFSVCLEIIKILRDVSEQESKIIVFSIFGQLLIWRAGRTSILRQMNWTTIGEDEFKQVQEIVHRNITALIYA